MQEIAWEKAKSVKRQHILSVPLPIPVSASKAAPALGMIIGSPNSKAVSAGPEAGAHFTLTGSVWHVLYGPLALA